MHRISKALRVITVGGVLGLLGSIALPATAWAQATDVDCNKCVDKGDVAKKAITKKKIKPGAVTSKKIADGAVTETKLSPALQQSVGERQSFYVTLDANLAEQTIATNGALEYFVRCRINDGGQDRVQIIVTSTIAGWYNENNSTTAQLASVEIVALAKSAATTTASFDNDNAEDSNVAPDGSFISISGESIGLGVNIFGHACLAVGHVNLITGTL